MTTTTPTTEDSNTIASRRLAAEDVRVGMHITVLREICELVSFLWPGDTPPADRETPVTYRHTPGNSGEVYEVLGVCLPFVLTEDINGCVRRFDVRLCELAALTTDYVEAVRRKQDDRKDNKSAKKRKRRKAKARRSGK